ncbi:hypothetical protein EVAR_95995_1 [Eumeta japonica]|uniref:Uncharacterized protein n=1 Tax=Eumeta variegata TaxID=151549 RepID=A0A4C1ZYQ0_EUMVA|nr:hypothetical protein EVAR_95995_1 [Eumeta japonica]
MRAFNADNKRILNPNTRTFYHTIANERRSRPLVYFILLCQFLQLSGVLNANNVCEAVKPLVFFTLWDICMQEANRISRAERHHPTVFISLLPKLTSYTTKPRRVRKLDINKCTFAVIKSEMQKIDWSMVLSSEDENELVESSTGSLKILLQLTQPSLADVLLNTGLVSVHLYYGRRGEK